MQYCTPSLSMWFCSGGYLYYIYTEDDAEMEEILDFGLNTGDPYRTFER